MKLQYDKRILKYSALGIICFYLVAHAFANLNFAPQHDALNYLSNFAGAGEVQLGRYFLPVYGMLRGNIATPWMSGVLSMLYLIGVCSLVCSFLQIDDKVQIMLIAGFLSCNVTITELCGVFTYVEDAFLLALLFGCIGVYAVTSFKPVFGVVVATVCFTITLGLYQAFISSVIVLMLLRAISELTNSDRIEKSMFFLWIREGISLLLGAILYYIGYRVALVIWKVGEGSSYNSIGALRNISLFDIPGRLVKWYKGYASVWIGEWCPTGMVTIICNFALILATVITCVWIIHKKENKRILRLCLCVLISGLLPFASFLADLAINGETLTYRASYAIWLLYLFIISVLMNRKSSKWIRLISVILAGIILYRNILFSNQAYTYQNIIYERGKNDTWQILQDMNQKEEYIPGVTEVVLIGNFSDDYNLATFPFDKKELAGNGKTAITYTQTFGNMAWMLGENVNWTSNQGLIETYLERDDVWNMPIYPNEGYCQMIDGRMVIKLSE